MVRIWLLMAVVYAYGDQGFSGLRPGALEKPLLEFHRVVNESAANVREALVKLDVRTLPVRESGDKLRQLLAALR
jgi:hypothetical protein